MSGEGVVAADEDGLAGLVLAVGAEVRACVEMMSGAVWVRDRLEAAGWEVQVAHPRKVRGIAWRRVSAASSASSAASIHSRPAPGGRLRKHR